MCPRLDVKLPLEPVIAGTAGAVAIPKIEFFLFSVVSQYRLYNNPGTVIPAKAGIQIKKTVFRI